MALTILYVGKDEVLEAFDKRAKKPYWAVFDKGVNLYQFEQDDFEMSKEVLADFLDVCIKRKYANPLTLKFCSESEDAYSAKSKCYGNFAFQCSESAPAPNFNPTDIQAYYMNEINTLKAEINAMKMKWDPLDEDDDENEEDEESDTQRMINGVNTILENPLVIGLINRLTAGNARVNNLAGADLHKAEYYVQLLFEKGVTVDHLRKLSEMSEPKIKMLLSML